MKKILFFVLILIISCKPESSVITAGSAIVTIESLNSAIDDAISNAEFAYNNSLNNTVNQIKSINYDLKHNIESSIDNVDDMLTKQQYSSLEKILNINDTFYESLSKSIDKTDDLTNNFAQAISSIPFINKEPRITSLNIPNYIIDFSNNVKITFKGYNLDNEKNYFSIGDILIKPSTQTSTSISFILSKSDIEKQLQVLNKNKTAQIIDKKGTLHLFYKKGFFSRTKEKKLPMNIKALPKNIGTVSIVYQVNEYEGNIEHMATNNYGVSTPGPRSSGRKTRRGSYLISAPKKLISSCNKIIQGSIVPGSIKTFEVANRYGGGVSISSETSVGFNLNITAKSQKKLYGGGGLFVARAEYKVSYPCKVKKDKTINSIPLEIGKDIAYDFTNESEPIFKRLVINFFDGTKKIINDADTKTYLVHIIPNNSKRELIIKTFDAKKN